MYQNNAKLCYMDTALLFYIKTEDFYEDNAEVQMMLKKYLMHQIKKLIDHYQKERIKSNWINER